MLWSVCVFLLPPQIHVLKPLGRNLLGDKALTEVKIVKVTYLGQVLFQHDTECMKRENLEVDVHIGRVPCRMRHAENTVGGDGGLLQATGRDLRRSFLHIPQKKPTLSITPIAAFQLPQMGVVDAL